jgi:xanthine dehydrogenase accessory factor
MNETDRIIEAASRAKRGFVATIVRTSGSTYRRPGARCVISDDGEVAGTISGGCLEKDLIARSDEWMRDMQPRTITYDSSRDDDIVFGLGLGCRGVIEIRIEPFDSDHRPQIDREPRKKMALFGGGPDVQPLAKMAELIGWDVHVTAPRDVHPEQVTAPAGADAIVIMTHNYLYDLALLRTMLASDAKYIGLLGPRSRGEQLLAECGGDRNRIHSPAGLNIGGETPEEIALSILAEAQSVLNERDARQLKELEGPLHADDHRPGCRRV